MCSLLSEDSGGKVLFCCNDRIHRYCAGVSLAHYDSIQSDAEDGDVSPFLCLVCTQKVYREEVEVIMHNPRLEDRLISHLSSDRLILPLAVRQGPTL